MAHILSSCLIVAGFLVVLSSAFPYGPSHNHILGDHHSDQSLYYPRTASAEDSHPSASEHDHYGRVQIKVYRGPTTHQGHEHFAPHGFWVKQPADDHH